MFGPLFGTLLLGFLLGTVFGNNDHSLVSSAPAAIESKKIYLNDNSWVIITIFLNWFWFVYCCSIFTLSYTQGGFARDTRSLLVWISDAGDLQVYWNFLFDNVTAPMVMIVLFISNLVQVYSCEYMRTDANFMKFFFFKLIYAVYANTFNGG